MKASFWILALFLLSHSPSSLSIEDLALPSSPRSRRLLSNDSSLASPPSSASCRNSSYCESESRVAVRGPNILPHSRTLTIAVVIIFVACILMGFFSVYARRFCITDGNLNVNYQSMERAEYRGNQALVGSLPTVQYEGTAAAGGQEGKGGMMKKDCAVCLSEFEEGETLRVLPACGHLFHKDCIDMWLFSHSTCPLCRLSLFKHKGHLSRPDQHGTSNNSPPRVPLQALDLQPMLNQPPLPATSSA